MAIEIRLLKEGEHLSANDFHRRIYGHGRSLEQFEWEFFNGPSGKAIYVVAVDTDKEGENKIVGTQCAIPLEMRDGDGKVILTAKSEDTLIDASYRGKNIFELMYKFLFEKCEEAGIHYIWGFTYVKKPFQKVGFQIPYDATQGVYVTSVLQAFRHVSKLNPKNILKDKVKILGLCILSRIRALSSFPSRLPEGYSITNESIIDKSTLQMEVIGNQKNYIFLNQSKPFIQWRVTNNPYPNKYCELSLIDKAGHVVGNLIYNIRKEGFAYICQLILKPDLNVKIKIAFVKAAIHEISNKGVFLIRFWGFQTNPINKDEIAMLDSSGFTFIKRGSPFVWKTMRSGDKNLKPDNIILSRLYTQGNY